MRKPMSFGADEMVSYPNSDSRGHALRPIDGGPWWDRWRLAWAVFTGRADALFWGGGQ